MTDRRSFLAAFTALLTAPFAILTGEKKPDGRGWRFGTGAPSKNINHGMPDVPVLYGDGFHDDTEALRWHAKTGKIIGGENGVPLTGMKITGDVPLPPESHVENVHVICDEYRDEWTIPKGHDWRYGCFVGRTHPRRLGYPFENHLNSFRLAQDETNG